MTSIIAVFSSSNSHWNFLYRFVIREIFLFPAQTTLSTKHFEDQWFFVETAFKLCKFRGQVVHAVFQDRHFLFRVSKIQNVSV